MVKPSYLMEDYTEDMFVDEFTLSDTDKLPLEEIF